MNKQDEYSDRDWQLFVDAQSAAQEALDNPILYKLDQEGVTQLEARLISAQNQLTTEIYGSLSLLRIWLLMPENCRIFQTRWKPLGQTDPNCWYQ